MWISVCRMSPKFRQWLLTEFISHTAYQTSSYDLKTTKSPPQRQGRRGESALADVRFGYGHSCKSQVGFLDHVRWSSCRRPLDSAWTERARVHGLDIRWPSLTSGPPETYFPERREASDVVLKGRSTPVGKKMGEGGGTLITCFPREQKIQTQSTQRVASFYPL